MTFSSPLTPWIVARAVRLIGKPSSPPSIWLTVSGRAEDSALIPHADTAGSLSITWIQSSTDPGNGGLGQGGGSGPSALFKQRDTNSDGKLGKDELPAALFDKLDADKDGFVTQEELKALRKQ